MGYVKCREENCDEWFKFDEHLPNLHDLNKFCAFHGGKSNSHMPITPFRRCIHLDERGQQCESYFEALGSDKLCETHRAVPSTGNRNGQTEEQKVRYIDLVNDERTYCYHFLDGSSQNQDKTLIHEFKDDAEGTIFEKLDRHIGFLEKVIEDTKARLHSARAVKIEKLENLTEEQRKELRKIKIEKAVKSPSSPSIKKDPTGYLMKKNNMSEKDANALLTMDADDLIAKFKKMKELKEKNV